jgi:hypothetical protein
MNINLAYYRKKDWDRLLNTADDRDTMHDTWEEWHKLFLKTKNDLASKGYAVSNIVIDIDELNRYCKERGLKNDGEARSQFAAEMGI